MSDNILRSQLIRLAHAKPELRPHLLPILAGKTAAASKGSFEESIKGKKFRNPSTGKDVLFKSLPAEEQKKLRSQWESKNTAKDEDNSSGTRPAYRPAKATDKMVGGFLEDKIYANEGNPDLLSKAPKGLRQKVKEDADAYESATHAELSSWLGKNKDKLNRNAPALKGVPDNKVPGVLMEAWEGMEDAFYAVDEPSGFNINAWGWEDFFVDDNALQDLEGRLKESLRNPLKNLGRSVDEVVDTVTHMNDDD